MRMRKDKPNHRIGQSGSRSGVSMAIVVCIGALLLAFALAMAYTGSLMMADAGTRLEQEKVYQLAASFGQVLDEEIRKGGEQEDKTVLPPEKWSEFYRFARRFVGNSAYRDYDDTDKERTVYTYYLEQDSLGADYGTLKIELYKQLNDSMEDENHTLTYGSGTDYTDLVEEIRQVEHYRRTLTVKVTVTRGELQYSYETEYDCAEKLTPAFSYQGKTISWNSVSGKWVEGDTTAGSPVAITEGAEISYTYRTDDSSVISRTFKNLHEQSGEEAAP